MLLNAFGHSSSRSPSTSTSSAWRGCLNFFSRSTALRPVQPPRAPSSISVGRIAASSPKIGASSICTVCPEADSMSKSTLVPVQRATVLVIGATIYSGQSRRGEQAPRGLIQGHLRPYSYAHVGGRARQLQEG